MSDAVHIQKSHPSSLTWYISEKIPRHGVALVIHGLNLKPCKMESLIKILNEAGIDAALLSLSGHGNSFKEKAGVSTKSARLHALKKVTYSMWYQESLAAYTEIQKHAVAQDFPIFLVGYSLGALMGCCLLVSDPAVCFNKLVLFAPALRPYRLGANLINLLSPFPRLVIPSRSPPAYRTNRGTPVTAYLSLFDAVRAFDRNINSRLNIPTLMFMDPADELVSFSQTKSLVSNFQLNQWQLHPIQNNRNRINHGFRHLLIDDPAVGEENWGVIWQRMTKFLNIPL